MTQYYTQASHTPFREHGTWYRTQLGQLACTNHNPWQDTPVPCDFTAHLLWQISLLRLSEMHIYALPLSIDPPGSGFYFIRKAFLFTLYDSACSEVTGARLDNRGSFSAEAIIIIIIILLLL
jgi:hypothetical protein